MEEEFDCSLCLEQYALPDREPKVLRCGHTFCLQCLNNLTTPCCPLDRSRFRESVGELPRNHVLLSMIARFPTAKSTQRSLAELEAQREETDRQIATERQRIATTRQVLLDRRFALCTEVDEVQATTERLRRTIDDLTLRLRTLRFQLQTTDAEIAILDGSPVQPPAAAASTVQTSAPLSDRNLAAIPPISVPGVGRRFKCPSCEALCKSSDKLIRHFRQTHSV